MQVVVLSILFLNTMKYSMGINLILFTKIQKGIIENLILEYYFLYPYFDCLYELDTKNKLRLGLQKVYSLSLRILSS